MHTCARVEIRAVGVCIPDSVLAWMTVEKWAMKYDLLNVGDHHLSPVPLYATLRPHLIIIIHRHWPFVCTT